MAVPRGFQNPGGSTRNPNVQRYQNPYADVYGATAGSPNRYQMTATERQAQQAANQSRQSGGREEAPLDYGTETQYTGWMAPYAQGAVRDILYDAPQFLLRDVMDATGIGYVPGSALYNQLYDLSGADPLSLWAMMMGATADAYDEGTDNAYGNWLGAMYYNQMMPGGAIFDFSDMMSNIFSMATGDAENPNPSVLFSLLTAGTGAQQVSNLYNMVRDAARVSLNPLAATAALTALERAGTAYLQDLAKGIVSDAGKSPFYQWLRERNPGLVSAFAR